MNKEDDRFNLEKWNRITDLKDCPPLDKEVLAIHDDHVYIGFLMKSGEGFCWKLDNDYALEWVDIYDVDYWIEKESYRKMTQTKISIASIGSSSITFYNHMREIELMMEREGFDPNEFRLCEVPTDGVYCFDRITSHLGIDYFVVDVVDNGRLVPTYVTYEANENGHNCFETDSILQSMTLNAIWADQLTFPFKSITSNSVFLKDVKLLDLIHESSEKEDEKISLSESQQRFYKRLISLLEHEGIALDDWQIDEIAYLKEEIHHVLSKEKKENLVIKYDTKKDAFFPAYFAVNSKGDYIILQATNVKEAINKYQV
ncbi:hypothetical protein Q5W88_21550 [Shouchella clausii]|uniref:hypothetical protein n=1 Tax=Shouchella clausii TaxID=79880 RepID=UPI0026F40DBE|nr:hypothetical protein [Shouchella clausii]MDO7285892.1 hypothetical protein [Shouchella clausii]MDO7305795.1 hypothetical protein [Shouchella clausii]